MVAFITGNTDGGTGISTGEHLHFGVQDLETGEYEDPGRYAGLLLANGKPLAEAFTMTSGYGPRNRPSAGASSYHRGIDYGTPTGTLITMPGSKFLRTWEDANGGGVVNEYEFTDPKSGRRKKAKMLHGHKDNLRNITNPPATTGGGGSASGTATTAGTATGGGPRVTPLTPGPSEPMPAAALPGPVDTKPSAALGLLGSQLLENIREMGQNRSGSTPFSPVDLPVPGQVGAARFSPVDLPGHGQVGAARQSWGGEVSGRAGAGRVVTKPMSRGALGGVLVGSPAQLQAAGAPAPTGPGPAGPGPTGRDELLQANINRSRWIRA